MQVVNYDATPAGEGIDNRRRSLGGNQSDHCSGDCLQPCDEHEDVKRQVNWTIGVTPQDVRFPTNICEVAFTANYFAALTKDKVKIFVNKRVPGEKANCKKKTIEFNIDDRPMSIISYDNRDILCVLFESKVEFHNLATQERASVYHPSHGEVVTSASALYQRAPLVAMWCTRNPKKPTGYGRPSALTLWAEQVMVPQQLPLSGVLRKSEKYCNFHWTSDRTVLMFTKVSDAKQKKPLEFCSFDIATRKVRGRLSKSHRVRSFCMSSNGRQALLVSRSQYQLVDAVSLQRLRVHKHGSANMLPYLEHAINDNGDLAVLNKQKISIEIYPGVEHVKSLQPRRTCDLTKVFGVHELGKFSLHAIGNFGLLFIFHHDGCDKAGEPKQYSSYSVVVLTDLQGHVLLQAHWPRGFVQQVTDEQLVFLQYLCVKPFSAAHARIFNFSCPLIKNSYWQPDSQCTE